MSSFSGRRGASVTNYIQNLNTIPSEPILDTTYNPAEDLSLWTDTTFFDFDLGEPARNVSPPIEERKQPAIDPNLDAFLEDFPRFDQQFEYNPAFNFADAPAVPDASAQNPVTAATPMSPPVDAPTPSSTRGTKRKSIASGDSSIGLEDGSRMAAEEDKRRRNTAASARFRIKKKQKEQQLEKTARDMTDRCQQLEQRIQTLEMENKWLKNLIVEKNGGKSGEELVPPSALQAPAEVVPSA